MTIKKKPQQQINPDLPKPTTTAEFLASVSHLPQDQQLEEYHKFMMEQQQEQQKAQAKQVDKVALFGTKKTTDFVVADKEFTIVHWSPTKVHQNIPRIGRYFITPLSMLIGGAVGEDPESFNPADAIPTALSYLFTILEEDDIMNLYDLVLETVHYNDKPVMGQFDEVFSDDPFGVFDLVAEVLRINVIIPFTQRNGSLSLKNLTNNLMPLVEVAKLK